MCGSAPYHLIPLQGRAKAAVLLEQLHHHALVAAGPLLRPAAKRGVTAPPLHHSSSMPPRRNRWCPGGEIKGIRLQKHRGTRFLDYVQEAADGNEEQWTCSRQGSSAGWKDGQRHVPQRKVQLHVFRVQVVVEEWRYAGKASVHKQVLVRPAGTEMAAASRFVVLSCCRYCTLPLLPAIRLLAAKVEERACQRQAAICCCGGEAAGLRGMQRRQLGRWITQPGTMGYVIDRQG